MPKESKQQVYKEYKAPIDEKENIQKIENDIWIG